MAGHLYLIGFMGAGKSTVGPMLAEQMGRPFVDLDARIETRCKKSIAQIFEDDGEGSFRQLETEELGSLATLPSSVVATGGGLPMRPENLQTMLDTGSVIGLSVSFDEVSRRISDVGERPLFKTGAAESLFRERQAVYRQAHGTVLTDGCPPQRVAQIVHGAAQIHTGIDAKLRASTKLCVLGKRSYPIVTASGALSRLPEIMGAVLDNKAPKVFVVSDDNVGPLYGDRVLSALKSAGIDAAMTQIPPGEAEKNFSRLESLASELAPRLDRSSVIVALGGGVVGDLTGFLASGLFRGIPVVQLPTTVVAMTDSAIGGKTAVNLGAGKNLFGAFWQPHAVVADTDVLATLPVRERRAALGELVKYGLLDGPALFADVAAIAPALGAEEYQEIPGLASVIRRCAGYKAWIVSRDERESGERALLNLGHTIGHAIEAEAGYGNVLHGEAVALGLLAACRFAEKKKFAGAELFEAVLDVFRAAKLDTDLDRWLTQAVFDRVGVDKKRTGNRVRFIVPCGQGHTEIHPFSPAEIANTLQS